MNFIETISVSHQKALHIEYHQARVNWTLEAHDCDPSQLNIEKYVESKILEQSNNPLLLGSHPLRCKVVYSDSQFLKCEFFEYKRRMVESLQVVDGLHSDYYFKYENRRDLDFLMQQKGDCDDILIVQHGYLTDTSIGNVALYNGKEWHTPSEPLLRGTTRKRLIDEHIILPREIRVDHLKNYSKICIFNALIPFEAVQFSTHQITTSYSKD
ncbi:aminotransferase class IV [Gammaproteobacteria bacterium]|nr:aminotransferase class IV [Gammaproteobacteria bacterium]